MKKEQNIEDSKLYNKTDIDLVHGDPAKSIDEFI